MCLEFGNSNIGILSKFQQIFSIITWENDHIRCGQALSVLENDSELLILLTQVQVRGVEKKNCFENNLVFIGKIPLLFQIRLCSENRRPTVEIINLSDCQEFTLSLFFQYREGQVQTKTHEVLGVRRGCGEDKTMLPFTFPKCVHRLHNFPDLTVICLPITQFTIVMIKNHKTWTFS